MRHKGHKRRDLCAKEWLVNIAPTDKKLFQGGLYVPGLARYPGDRRAVVSSRSEVRKILDAEGWAASGVVEHTPSQWADRPKKPYEVADDIVDRHLERLLHETGPMSDDQIAEARDQIKRRLSGEPTPESEDEIWNED